MATMKTLNGYGFNATEFNGKTSDSYLLKTDTAANSADSAKLGGKAPEYYIQPRNLLDNSDFTNPVNQRGQTSYTGQVYGIDRWYGGCASQKVEIRNTDVTVTATGSSYAGIKQKIANIDRLAGKTVTLAAYVYSTVGVAVGFTDADDNAISETVDDIRSGLRVILCTCTVPSNATPDTFIPRILLRTTAQNDYMRCYWAALYEDSYTAETLPPYVPKGYAAELAECQRYYYRMNLNSAPSLGSGWAYKTNNRIPITLPMAMRITPTVQMDVVSNFQIIYNNATYNATDISIQNCTFNHLTLNVVADTGISDWAIVSSRINRTATIEFSADL